MNEAARAPAPTDHETFPMLVMLGDSAADFCRRSLPVTRLRALRAASPAFDRALWRAMCELGWAGILAPEASGGLGLGAAAVGVVCRQLGRVLAPEPMLETGVGAVAMLSACASPAAESLLATVVSGETLLVCALAEDAEFASRAATGLTARVQDDGLVADLQAGHAVVSKALAELAVGTAVLHLFVETVHGDQIRRPAGGIAVIPRRLGGRDFID